MPKDCIDDFGRDVFTYNSCNDNKTFFKCDVKKSMNFGKCFNLNETFGISDICNHNNETTLKKIGYWKTSFPSQDYWTYDFLDIFK